MVFFDQRYIGRAVFLRATAGGVLADNEGARSGFLFRNAGPETGDTSSM
jgi:hypothetical protein